MRHRSDKHKFDNTANFKYNTLMKVGEMMREITYYITKNDDGRKIKNILRQNLGISAAVLTKLKQTPEGILLNGKSVFATQTVNKGDVITITLSDESSPNIVPSHIPLDIIYEDEDILAVNKPRNMPCHPSQNHHDDTLANGVMHYYKEKGFTFRVITRLDKDTSGVVLIAKNKISASILSDHMLNGKIYKEYVALCHDAPKDTKGTIDAPIARKDGSAIMREVNPLGKKAVTKFEVIQNNDDFSLIKLNPMTGRTHQIRVHLSHIGCPIYGDDMYGSPLKNEKTRLHCRKISFNHPITKKKLIIEAPIPEDMKK